MGRIIISGIGKRLFADSSDRKTMHLVGNQTVALVLLTYTPSRSAAGQP